MKILMRNIGMTLFVVRKLQDLGLDNVQVNMDWQHLIMNGEHLPEYAALLASEGLLGHQHANSGWGTFDDDNMVGATAFMETLELALELRRCGYGSPGRTAGVRSVSVHRGPGGRGSAVGAAVAVHRLGGGADRRRRAARGAGRQGRGARVRDRLRGSRVRESVGFRESRAAGRASCRGPLVEALLGDADGDEARARACRASRSRSASNAILPLWNGQLSSSTMTFSAGNSASRM